MQSKMGENGEPAADVDEQVKRAKAYLQRQNDKFPGLQSLYSQLSDVVKELLKETPPNSVDILEQYVKRLNTSDELKQTVIQSSSDVTHAEEEIKLFQRDNDGDGDVVEAEEDFDIPLPDMMELSNHFEQAGFGLGRQEMYCISLALRQLAINLPLESVRFWGKMFGINADYIIAEVEYREGEEDEEPQQEEKSSKGRAKKLHRNRRKERNYKTNNKRHKTFRELSPDSIEERSDGTNDIPQCTVKWCVRCGKVIWRSEAVVVTATVDHDRTHPRPKPQENKEDQEEPQQDNDEGEDGDPVEEDNIPQSTWKPPPEIPSEVHHTGTNKKVFFVCNKVGGEWKKLPHITPAQITAARQIKKFFTGNLDAPVVSYPPFPGTEANYLRAQIARISAGTQISPAGYYAFDDEEEEEEEDDARNSYTVNPDFDGLTVRELLDPTMSNWVHHVQAILPQGRCTWFNPFQKPEDDFEDDDMDEDLEDEEEAVQPEVGPPLLSSVSEDNGATGIPAWTAFLSSKLLPEFSLVVARSNHWPGSVAFAKGRKFENVYIGFGQKYAATNYSPPMPPKAFEEYPIDESLIEMEDPTVEEENALKQAEEEARRETEDMDGDDDDDEDD